MLDQGVMRLHQDLGELKGLITSLNDTVSDQGRKLDKLSDDRGLIFESIRDIVELKKRAELDLNRFSQMETSLANFKGRAAILSAASSLILSAGMSLAVNLVR